MVNLNLSPATADELGKMLDLLQARGLMNLLTSAPATASAPVAPVQKPGGHLAALHARTKARLTEKGLLRSPSPTDAEKALREVINAEREKAKLKSVNWKVDLVAREQALAAKGFDIYANLGDVSSEEEEEDGATLPDDFSLDLEQVPV